MLCYFMHSNSMVGSGRHRVNVMKLHECNVACLDNCAQNRNIIVRCEVIDPLISNFVIIYCISAQSKTAVNHKVRC